jgi:hypothetical protein
MMIDRLKCYFSKTTKMKHSFKSNSYQVWQAMFHFVSCLSYPFLVSLFFPVQDDEARSSDNKAFSIFKTNQKTHANDTYWYYLLENAQNSLYAKELFNQVQFYLFFNSWHLANQSTRTFPFVIESCSGNALKCNHNWRRL